MRLLCQRCEQLVQFHRKLRSMDNMVDKIVPCFYTSNYYRIMIFVHRFYRQEAESYLCMDIVVDMDFQSILSISCWPNWKLHTKNSIANSIRWTWSQRFSAISPFSLTNLNSISLVELDVFFFATNNNLKRWWSAVMNSKFFFRNVSTSPKRNTLNCDNRKYQQQKHRLRQLHDTCTW